MKKFLALLFVSLAASATFAEQLEEKEPVDGEYATYDGVTYTADLKELVSCPREKTSVDIPPECTTLPARAFAACLKLEKITGGAGLLYVGPNAFGETSDEAIERGESSVAMPAIPFVRAFPSNSFMKVGKVLIGYRGEVPAKLTIPADVRAIADGAFSDGKFAEVEFVGAGAASALRWVGKDAFSGNALNDTGILDGVIFNFGGRSVEDGADPASWKDRKIVALTADAFAGNNAITNVTIPATVEEVGANCFAGCPNLESVAFLGTPAKLGAGVFAGSPNLVAVRFEQALFPPMDVDDGLYADAPTDLVTYVPGSASKWPADDEGNWMERALDRSIHVIAQEGVYGKWTLAELGVTLPKAGTVFTPKAYGLPSGLVLKSNKAVKNKKGKVTVKAKTSWWIEGVPLEPSSYEIRPAYIVVPLNGQSVWQPLQLEVRAMETMTALPQFMVNVAAEDSALPGVGKGWTVSGLPAGLKFATKAVTRKVTTKVNGKKKKVTQTLHKAYIIYGTPTQAGLFTVVAKKKMSNGYYSLKKFWLGVADDGGTVPVDAPEIVSGFTGGDEILQATVGLADQFDAIEVSEGTTLTASGLPKGVTLKLQDGSYVFTGVPTVAGTYYVTITAVKNGQKVVRRQPVHFKKLPTWVQGSYNGIVTVEESENVPSALTMTVSAAGKVSGKFVYQGKTYTINCSGLSDFEDGETPDERRCMVRGVSATYVPVDSKGRKLTSKAKSILLGDLAFEDSESWVSVNAGDGDVGCVAWQNRWATAYKVIGAALQKLPHAWTVTDPDIPNLSLKISLDAKGAVKGTVSYPTGLFTKKKVGKKTVDVEVMYTATCSTVLIPWTRAADGAGGFDGIAYLVFPSGTKKVGKKTFVFPGTMYPATYSNLSKLFSVKDSWATGQFYEMAAVTLAGTTEAMTYGEGELMVKVASSDGKSFPFAATFKNRGDVAVEFSGKFSLVSNVDEPYYMARSQITFANGAKRVLELTIRPQEGEAEIIGQLDARFFGEVGQESFHVLR